MQGLFVTFEGPEGSGKSTHAARIAARLRGLGHKVLTTREPGGTATGEAIRGILQHDSAGEAIAAECELLLFAACRAQLVRQVIEPALARGEWVICDRFADSTTAYQGYGRGFDIATVERINGFAVGTTLPALTFVLDVDTAAGLRRVAARVAATNAGLDRIEREATSFHERVRAGYLDIARKSPQRCCVVDSGAEPDDVHGRIWGLLAERYGDRL